MRVVVTGGSGRLGQFVVRELFTHAHQVSAIDTVKPRECPCPTYVVDLDKVEPLIEQFNKADAVIHLARHAFSVYGKRIQRATQRWEFSDIAGDAERFNANVAMTNNVLAAAQAARINESRLRIELGGLWPVLSGRPNCCPITCRSMKTHPLRPQDPYGLTKLVGEKLCDAFSQKTGMQIASLRFSGIYTEEHRAMLPSERTIRSIRGTGALWSYIDVRDAARACRLGAGGGFRRPSSF